MRLIWGDIIEWARHDLGTLMLASLAAYILLLLLVLVLFIRQSKLSRQMAQLKRDLQNEKRSDEPK